MDFSLLDRIKLLSVCSWKVLRKGEKDFQLFIQKEKLWLLKEELLYVVNRIYRFLSSYYHMVVALNCYLN